MSDHIAVGSAFQIGNADIPHQLPARRGAAEVSCGADGIVCRTTAEIPVGPGQGTWLHPKDSGYRVHFDRDLAEIALLR